MIADLLLYVSQLETRQTCHASVENWVEAAAKLGSVQFKGQRWQNDPSSERRIASGIPWLPKKPREPCKPGHRKWHARARRHGESAKSERERERRQRERERKRVREREARGIEGARAA